VVAIFLFNNIEVTFNNIWHVKKKRPIFGKLTSLWTVLTLTPILFGISFYLAAKFTARSEGIVPAWIVPYLLNTLAFWVAYQFIPYTNIRLRASVIAAVVVAILWEIAKAGFNWYITNLASFRQIYGSLGTVPVFLLWLYLTWVIVLFGTELAYAIQYPHKDSLLGNAYREFYAVRAMAEISRMFGERKGGKRNVLDRMRSIGIPPDIIGDILNQLAKEGLLIFTEGKDYYLARAPSTITVSEIIEAVSGAKLLAPPAGDDLVSRELKKKFEEASEQITATLDGLNLQELITGDNRQKQFDPEVEVK
jgi:membrane protein